MLYRSTSKILFPTPQLLKEANLRHIYKVRKYMLSGPCCQQIKQRTRRLKAHKIFCCESELNPTGFCVFFFKTSLHSFSKVCYLVSCVLLVTIIVLLDDKLLSPPSLMSSMVHSSHCENGLHEKRQNPGLMPSKEESKWEQQSRDKTSHFNSGGAVFIHKDRYPVSSGGF